MISIFQKPRIIFFTFFMILFGIGLSCKKRHTKKKSLLLLPFQNSSPIILQNIFKYLNLEDFSTIEIAYQKSKSLILQKQFLKISNTFSKKTLHHEMIFEFTINSENLSPIKETKFLNSFLKSKPIKFSNFINHVMIYHEFRFISYIDGSFSIEQKINDTKHYTPIAIQKLSRTEKRRELENPHFVGFLRKLSKQFLNFAFEKNPRLYMRFKNAQISDLDYSISVDSEKNTYFVLLDKTYVVRFFNSSLFVYHIPTGKEFSFDWLSWTFSRHRRTKFNFKPLTQFGILLPSCHHPKVKQINFENKIKNGVVLDQDRVFIKFQLYFKRAPNILQDDPLCFADHLYMNIYL